MGIPPNVTTNYFTKDSLRPGLDFFSGYCRLKTLGFNVLFRAQLFYYNQMSKISPISFSSCFSFGYGATTPEKMAEAIATSGFSSLPITDEASFAGLPAACKAAEKYGLSLLSGQRYSFVPKASMLLYPDNEKAYEWVNKLASFAATKEQKTGQSLSDFVEKFQPVGAGRCIINELSLCGLAETFKVCGWKVYFSIQPRKSLKELTELQMASTRHGFMPILSPDLLCAAPDDYLTVKLIRALSSGLLLEDVENFEPLTPTISSAYTQLINTFPGAAATNHEFAAQSSWQPQQNILKMPVYGPSSAETISILQNLAYSELKKRYQTVTATIQNRFNYEMEIIAKLGFADYFMVVHDITTKARELGHRVLGRGSAANSIISYALNFTQVDPIKYNLYFERFLNEARRSPPDIDLDFSWKIRDQIYQHLITRWGSDNIALISTHISLRGRSAIRETGKTLGYSNEDISFVNSLIKASSTSQFISNPTAFSRFKVNSERLQQLLPMIKLAAAVENIPTHYSIHAGGVVIAPGSIYRFTPVVPTSKVLPITQLEMHGIEQFGLVKIDLLSQRSLGVYSDMIVETTGKAQTPCPADPQLIEQDAKVMKALAAGETMGVFYIESPGMRGLLKKLHCRTYTGLIAASSIIRPGVAESGMMQEYIRRSHQPQSWKPVHPLLGELLLDTYGVMVYQEDVMKVAHHIAGFSLADADTLRRAMSGKERSSERMQGTRELFLQGAKRNGIAQPQALEIWRQISSFCGYAFCKAHSASYAVLSLELLWFKLHYPALFMAAVINNRGGFYATQAYISEARRLGLTILPPDINLSAENFTCEENSLLTGLSFVRCLKTETIKIIMKQRQKNTFSSLEDFMERTRPDDREFVNLVNSGALKTFGNPVVCLWQHKLLKQKTLFEEPVSYLTDLKAPTPAKGDIIKKELEAMGFAVSGHPLAAYTQPTGIVSAAQISQRLNHRVKIFGLLIAAKSVTTSTGAAMKFLTIEDQSGLVEVIFFPEAWRQCNLILDQTVVLEVTGTVKEDHGQIVVHGDAVKKT